MVEPRNPKLEGVWWKDTVVRSIPKVNQVRIPLIKMVLNVGK